MTRFQRRLLWWSTGATAVTGLVYVWMKYMLTPADPWAVANHPLQPWVLKAHILVAPVMLFAVGMVWSGHIWRHYSTKLPTGRRTGVTAGAVFLPLVFSGYLIQAVTTSWLLTAVTWLHIGLGVTCAVALIMHRQVLRRRLAVRPGRLPVIRLEPSATDTGDIPSLKRPRPVEAPVTAETR
jgi:hypothetical protein